MLTKEESLALIKPHNTLILNMVSSSLERLKCLDSERHVLRKTSVANVYRDLLVDEARIRFSGREAEGIRLIDHSDTSFFIEFSGYGYGVDGAIWAKLKKVSKNLLTSNIPTKKAVAFSEQQNIGYTCQPFLDGEDWQSAPKSLQPVHVNIGHFWNELGTDVQAVFVTSPNGRASISWFEHISRGGEDFGQSPAASDNVSAFPYELEITRVKPKRVTKKASAQDNEADVKEKKTNERKS